MQTSRLVGGLICVLVVAIGAAFVWGIVVRSYWAVAIPVVIGFLGMLTLGFWIGIEPFGSKREKLGNSSSMKMDIRSLQTVLPAISMTLH